MKILLLALVFLPSIVTARELAAQDEIDLINQKIYAFDRLASKPPHPRFLKGRQAHAGIVPAMRAERKAGLDHLKNYLLTHSTDKLAEATMDAFKSASAKERAKAWAIVSRYIESTAEAAFVFYVTQEQTYLNEMSKRLRVFAPIIRDRACADDVAYSREYAFYFALAYDFSSARIAAADKTLIAEVLGKCSAAVLPTLPQAVIDAPDNGIVFNSLIKYAAALMLVRGVPEFDAHLNAAWLGQALRTYVPRLPIWGGPDGGYANGSSYFLWDTAESINSWDVLDRVLDYPIYSKPYVSLLPNFLLFMLPPGSPAGAFGDGAELPRTEDRARLGKSVMNRYYSDVSKWFVKAQTRPDADPARLNILLSPRENSDAPMVPTTLLSRLFSSVGIAAFHTSFPDQHRLSVFFKSSPFGNANHAHADQNSFVIFNKGKVLAMDSGVYDDYGTEHQRHYAKQTMAHNAITFDGGIGQDAGPGEWGTREAKGKIIRFNPGASARDGALRTDKGIEYDIVTGDASQAYGGELSKALRTLVFVRPATIVVIDQLESAKARTWEYNLHTTVGATMIGTNAPANELQFALADNVSFCVKVRAPVAMKRSEVSGYPSYPPAGRPDPHFWNKFSYASPSATGLIVSLLRIDCSNPPANENIAFYGAGASVSVGQLNIRIGPDGAVSVY